MSLTRYLSLLALATVSLAPGAFAASAETSSDDMSSLRQEIDSLKERVRSQDEEINRMKSAQGEEWLTQERAREIRSIVQDVLADADTRASLQADGATAAYDKGFFIASPDGNFKLKINGQIQFRYAFSRLSTRSINQLDPGSYTAAQQNSNVGGGIPLGFPSPGGPGTSNPEIKGYQGSYGGNNNIERYAGGFELRRVKLDFSGHVVDPSWQYKIQFAFSQNSSQPTTTTDGYSAGTVGGVQGTGGGNNSGFAGGNTSFWGLEDTYIVKVLDDNWSVKVGQFKSPFLKEELVSSKSQLAVERSLVNQFFSTKFTQGVEVKFQNDCFRILGSFNDGGESRNQSAIIGGTDSGQGFTQYALTGRAEWKIAGSWSQFEDMSSFIGDSFGAYVGAAVNWQRGGHNDHQMNPDVYGGYTGLNLYSNNSVNGATPATDFQYPNNIPTSANDDVTNLTYTVDTMWDFGGFSIFSAFVGNVAYNIPAGWAANPSGGFTSTAANPPGSPNNIPNNVSNVTSGFLTPAGQVTTPAYTFVPGYGYGDSPILSYGVVFQAGWFIVDDIELFGRYEWYNTLNNEQNDYAGSTWSYWGAVPGGSSPFANNTNNNGSNPGYPGPNQGINTPTDAYSSTNPYYAHNLGPNPYGAQHNSIITGGVNWYPAGVKNKNVKFTADLAYSIGPVLFTNGIYNQSIAGADYRYDGGQPGGGQWVGRFQLQLTF